MHPLAQGKHYARINDIDLCYHVHGEGPLVFATSPGWGVGAGYLQRGFEPLLDRFKVVFIDTRGSGGSSWPESDETMGSSNMADDIEALRKHLQLDQIDLLGHSNGGAIAISFAQRYARHCRKLVLVDSQLIGFNAEDAIKNFLVGAATDTRYREAAEFAGLPVPTTDEEFTAWLLKLMPLYFNDPSRHMQTFVDTLDGQVHAAAFHAQNAIDDQPGHAQAPLLSHILAETLVMVGRHDWVCPPIVSQEIAAGIPDARLVIYEDTGHMPWVEEREQFFADLREFLLRGRIAGHWSGEAPATAR
ncbi:alpha/beta hydrolase [Rhizobium sp. BK251]|uniref:alpha/beta fold hydrolase n=1 Tax=Rhizobium sp. BK251 TaxID=2512125 RepID=UPI001047419F|nr:alpha/beta hydrolase [Rhizobium sp. BK251]TCL62122.1 pimeloyl-ACP methyl ester carboxylesterase [Rhizobium sp. BK251]